MITLLTVLLAAAFLWKPAYMALTQQGIGPVGGHFLAMWAAVAPCLPALWQVASPWGTGWRRAHDLPGA